MDDSEPQFRSGSFKQGMRALQEVKPEERERIFKQIAPGTMRVLEEAMDMGWVPLAMNAEFTEAVHRVLGPAGTRAWARRVGNLSLQMPILRGILEAAVRIFGVSPRGFIKIAPRTYRATYRNCGDVNAVDIGPSSSRLTMTGLPALMRTTAYMDANAGGLECVFDYCHVDGTVAWRLDSEQGTAELTVSWKES